MKVLGNKFREARKKQRLSQTALAAGICTQATVSKIENKNRCESLDIFYSLCSKLNVKVNDYLADNTEQELESLLDQVEELCNLFNYKEAYERLNNYPVDLEGMATDLAVKYFYYKGTASAIGMENFEDALANLNQAESINRKSDFYSILIINSIAVTYILSEGLEKSQPYFEKTYQMLQEYPQNKLSANAAILYYRLAKYYSKIKAYQKSIELCDKGIQLCKRMNSNLYLDALLYEKAYNEYFLNGSKEGYRIAYYFTDFINHEEMMKYIKQDIAKYKVEL